MNHPNLFVTHEALLRFLLAGRATLTLRSRRTSERFTFKFQKKKESTVIPGTRLPIWVKVLTGPDNETAFQFVGTIWEEADGSISYVHSAKSKVRDPNAPSLTALRWLVKSVATRNPLFFEQAEAYHEGKCGRCGRKLTVPESILTGIGPECAAQLGATS